MRRRFFLFAAPAIVAAPSLMRVSTLAQLIVPEPLTVGQISLRELITHTLRKREGLLYAQLMKSNALVRYLVENKRQPILGLTS